MRDFLFDLWDQVRTRWEATGRDTAVWFPTGAGDSWLAPVLALGSLLALVLLSGVAVLSLGLMLASLLTAYLILENVFGVSIEVEGAARR